MFKVNLEDLRPRRERVLVRDIELEVESVTLDQHEKLLDFVGAIEAASIAEVVSKVMNAVVIAGGVGEDESGGVRVLTSLAGVATEVFAGVMHAARSLSGDRLSDTVGGLLDTERNFNKLRDARVLGDANAVDRDGPVYLGCADLRTWVRRSVTVAQALHIVTTALVVTDYVGVGKRLASVLLALRQADAPTNGDGRIGAVAEKALTE